MQLPTIDELQRLRKGLRKRKLPHVFHGMLYSGHGIGGVKLMAVGRDFDVEWVTFEDGVTSARKHAVWSELCSDPKLELQRLEIGYVVSAIYTAEGQKVMASIGHPMAAVKAVRPYTKAAEAWTHWGTVKAGHMLGL